MITHTHTLGGVELKSYHTSLANMLGCLSKFASANGLCLRLVPRHSDPDGKLPYKINGDTQVPPCKYGACSHDLHLVYVNIRPSWISSL